MNIKEQITSDFIVVYAIEGIYRACAEISRLKDNQWYFNRLLVPESLRNKGYATQLLKKLLAIVKEKDIELILEINPYGDLNFEQLEKLYLKHGFVKHEEHFIFNKLNIM